MRLLKSFAFSSAFLMVASCTNPASDVGLELLGNESNPQIQTIQANSFSASDLVDITGAASRVLVGSVDDPLTGQISASGFLDFTGTFAGGSSATITAAKLNLSRNYNFGDTLAPVEFKLHQIQESWDQSGLRADVTLEIGPPILTVTTVDSLVSIDLPTSWIDANQSTLQSSEFDSEFHGFALLESQGDQVIGFNSRTSTLELNSSSGSTIYNVGSTYTQVKRTRPSTPPEGLILFQDGVGPAVALDFDLDKVRNRPINGASLSIHSDLVASRTAPTNFLRSNPATLQLVATPANPTEPAILVGQATVSDSGEYIFSGADVSLFFQRVANGAQEYDHLELRAPLTSHSLDTILLYGTDSGDKSPRATIILSP